MGRIVIFGAGGCGVDVHAAVIRSIEGARGAPEILFCDDRLAGEAICGASVIAKPDILPGDRVIVAVADGRARERIANEIGEGSFHAATTLVSRHATIGSGSVLSDYVIIGPRTWIGRQFQGNYQSYVAHDCIIGDFVTFGPAVRCNGNVTIGDYAYIGCGAMIRQGISIGAGATVGMGAVVVKDVPPGATVVGNPATMMQIPAEV